jgi:N-methylhydantoinase B
MVGAFSLNCQPVAVLPQSLSPGDVYFMRLPGGGGWGDPKQRDRASLLSDMRNGYVSRDGARTAYGATVSDAELEEAEEEG